MDEIYDVCVLGTGLKESILSGLLSQSGKKVLVMDRNPYYGGESASLNLTNLYKYFKRESTPPESFGVNRDWNVDLIPKFVLAGGKLVKILRATETSQYLEWQVLDGSYVYQHQKGNFLYSEKFIHKVPASDKEALSSPLMGFLEKNRCHNFYKFVFNFNERDKSTWKNHNPFLESITAYYKHYGLEENTIDFLGHAVALYTNDDYLKLPACEPIKKMKLYMESLMRFGSSPFIYPVYGLGGIPEAFSRKCAIHRGTFMLNKPVKEFKFDEDGKVCGVVTAEGELARCSMVVCDPTYCLELAPEKVKSTGKVIRCICILSNPIPETNNASSCQIIIPQKQLNRKHDVYVTLVSYSHGVTSKGKFVCIISTTVETNDPVSEITPALGLIGKVEEHFINISDIYVPTSKECKDNIFVTESYDATSHFESASNDVLKLWREMTGSEYDLSKVDVRLDLM
ncbi:rabgdi protein, putative [Theileria annulata]|uniref:Rab GDP dissociation inhibitor n=1 Tax=Theileria annulata TaxID=5874 RepID=Q4UB69_THEAN|nr:rabgdi protein, putative [Theileria annulata]CAI75932.1 rabgdi protein, putative [Theileria annulata]|eukprot:XP_955408.1 rabgdi protein, putative [Theileria annulata]